MLTEIVGLITGILITSLVVATIITIFAMENKSRRIRQKMLHEERMLALEKGLPVPIDFTDTRSKRRPYIRGLVLTAIGCGIIVLAAVKYDSGSVSESFIGIGSIFVFVGIALLIGDRIAMSQNKEQNKYPSDVLQNQ